MPASIRNAVIHFDVRAVSGRNANDGQELPIIRRWPFDNGIYRSRMRRCHASVQDNYCEKLQRQGAKTSDLEKCIYQKGVSLGLH